MRVSITTLGCRVNSYESDAMSRILTEAGYTVVPHNESADICIVNTCTVTNIADRKSRQMISRCHRLNPKASVVVVGCWSQRFPQQALNMEGVAAIIGTTEKQNIATICNEILRGVRGANTVRDVSKEQSFESISAVCEGRTRAYLKIQDGCNHFCSYCAIPYARGRTRSRDLDSVRSELERLDSIGFTEVVLTGIHLTDYGKDIGGVDLADAVDCFEGLDNIKRIRFGSLEPHGLTDKIIERITAENRICKQFHISLQSGSATVLSRMKRGYSADEYRDIVSKIRSVYGYYSDRVAITTDIITGFPGESESEHTETLEFMDKVGFARVHVFPFSERGGTAAATMEGKLDNSIKNRRAAEIIEKGKVLERAFLERFVGVEESVLLETEKNGLLTGFTDSYVRVKTDKGSPNTIVNIIASEIKEEKNGELYLL